MRTLVGKNDQLPNLPLDTLALGFLLLSSPSFPHFTVDSSLLLCLHSTYTPPVPEMNVEKLMKMAGSVRTGGKGTMRRKKKAVHKTTTTDDKRLQSTLKRIGVNAIPAIEEVNIFKEDVVIQFTNPKVQASIAANTWVVSGTPQTKKLQDILPQIIHQLGPDNLENLKKLAEQFQKQVPGAGAGTDAGAHIAQEDDDDDVPDLVGDQTFEAAAEEGHTS
ncbi:basic transcription factor 3 [Forsythia ovata]|uniref:Nascent polypeptide-associated complex subunit beta n=1 Tax=Forsythia ovata TaxID=205694 RepID=A0ABD1UT72_9LAMI